MKVQGRLPGFMVALSWAAARLYAYMAGLRFDASPGRDFWHVADPHLLQTQLLRTLWNLHGQPPLFNGWLGLYQKAFGTRSDLAFHGTFLGIGAGIAQQTYALGRLCTLGRWLAALLAIVIACNPATLLFENYLFYSYPELLLLLAITNVSLVAVRAPSPTRWLLTLSAVLSALCLLRAMFHPVWAIGIFTLTAVMCRRPLARTKLMLTALPFLAVAMVCCKNAILFQSPSLSSWRGMNFARVVIDRMPKSLRHEWVEAGVLSPVARVGAFKPLPTYDSVLLRPRATGVAVLDQVTKSSGSPNFHHIAYVDISRRLERDSWTVIQKRPALYAKSVGTNIKTTFEPAWQYRALAAARPKLDGYISVWNVTAGLAVLPGGASAWLILAPALLALSAIYLVRFRDRKWEPEYVAVLLCALHISYVVVVGALLERSENQRFRFDVDPMLGVLAALACRHAWLAMRRRGAHHAVNTAAV